MKRCWYKQDDVWKTGFFHEWSISYDEFESGPGQFAAAIVEDATDSQVHVVFAEYVSFNTDHPCEDGWIGEAVAAKTSEYKKSKRFKPRLVWIASGSRWLVQVHPETIEVFNNNVEYVCQVRWIDGEMDYSQGGLPLATLGDMFLKANS